MLSCKRSTNANRLNKVSSMLYPELEYMSSPAI